MKLFSYILVVLMFAGCASVNDSLTPPMSVNKDDFDGSIIVRQSPVSAASSISEGWHTLGFEWNQNSPNTIFITAGTNGSVNITDVQFNVDGKIISNIKTASTLTEYDKWSTRRFSMSWSDFLEIANAKSVKMKVVQINSYTVSSFGPEHSGAVVNAKIPPFIKKVQELLSGASQ